MGAHHIQTLSSKFLFLKFDSSVRWQQKNNMLEETKEIPREFRARSSNAYFVYMIEIQVKEEEKNNNITK